MTNGPVSSKNKIKIIPKKNEMKEIILVKAGNMGLKIMKAVELTNNSKSCFLKRKKAREEREQETGREGRRDGGKDLAS